MIPPGIPPRSPSERSISPPPAAAPAAGGWGIGAPWPVHSAGDLGCLSAAFRRRRCGRCGVLVAELFLSGGGALCGAMAELSPSPSSRIFGSLEFVCPSPALAWRPRRIPSNNKKKEFVFGLTMKMMDRGVGSQEPATGDFPSAEGLLLIQAIKRRNGGGAPPASSTSWSSTSGSFGPVCIFYLILDFSVSSRL